MHRHRRIIRCSKHFKQTRRTAPFRIIRYVFNYAQDEADRVLLDKMVAEGKRLAAAVNPGAANHGTYRRPYERILNNCVAGLLAEHLWKDYLNHRGERVRTTVCEDVARQIDLETLDGELRIEVRASFPRNGIPFALCHPTRQFDVLGGYANAYKPGEIRKELYVRTLFHLKKTGERQGSNGKTYPVIEQLTERLYRPNFEVGLTGGCTYAMLERGYAKGFIPEDERDLARLKTKTDYRVLPFHLAMDSVEVFDYGASGQKKSGPAEAGPDS